MPWKDKNRGGGWSGGGDELSGLLGENESTWGLPPRCKICPDGIGDSADIAASDTWDGGSPPWVGQEDDPGFNAAIVRTQRGADLMEKAIAAGYIVRGEALSPAELNRVQPHQENKSVQLGKVSGVERRGPHGSGYPGALRLRSLYEENDPASMHSNARGHGNGRNRGSFPKPDP